MGELAYEVRNSEAFGIRASLYSVFRGNRDYFISNAMKYRKPNSHERTELSGRALVNTYRRSWANNSNIQRISNDSIQSIPFTTQSTHFEQFYSSIEWTRARVCLQWIKKKSILIMIKRKFMSANWTNIVFKFYWINSMRMLCTFCAFFVCVCCCCCCCSSSLSHFRTFWLVFSGNEH